MYHAPSYAQVVGAVVQDHVVAAVHRARHLGARNRFELRVAAVAHLHVRCGTDCDRLARRQQRFERGALRFDCARHRRANLGHFAVCRNLRERVGQIRHELPRPFLETLRLEPAAPTRGSSRCPSVRTTGCRCSHVLQPARAGDFLQLRFAFGDDQFRRHLRDDHLRQRLVANRCCYSRSDRGLFTFRIDLRETGRQRHPRWSTDLSARAPAIVVAR